MFARIIIICSAGLYMGIFSHINYGQAQGMQPMGFVAAAKPAAPVSAKSLLETISVSNRPRLTALLTNAGLISYFTGKATYTFFAPAESALTPLEQLPPDQIKDILLNYLVAGAYSTADLTEGRKLPTLGQNAITVLRSRGKIFINGLAITAANEPAANGLIHNLEGTFQLKP